MYSLALTLYECWARKHPVARRTPAATARAIGEPIPPLAEGRADLPPELARVIDDCLHPEPDARPSLEQLEAELDDVLPALSREPLAPREEWAEATGVARILHAPWLPGALSAISVGSLALAAGIATAAPLSALAFIAAGTALAAYAPRTAYLMVVASLLGWLLGTGEPGAALVLAVLTVPATLLVSSAGRLWPLPAAAPLLGLLGLAPLYAAVAGLCRTWPQRLVFGALGYVWLLVAEGAWRETLLFGVLPHAGPDWQTSVSTAAGDLLAPLFTVPALLGAGVWAVAAVCLAPLLRGRIVAVELLGVLVWAAGLLSLQRLLAEGERAGAPAAGLLVIALSLLVGTALAYRSGRAPPARRAASDG